MTVAIYSNPGKSVTIAVQTLDGYGERADGYENAIVDFIQLPSGSFASGYPLNMDKLTTGVYTSSFILPSGSSGVGTYIASVSWPDHIDPTIFHSELFLINAFLPFGNSSVSPA